MNVVGFLEQSPGVKSAARLVAALCGISIAAIGFACAFAIVYVAVHPEDRGGMTGLFGATAGLLTALGGGAWGALRERSEVGSDVTAIAATRTES